jgi:glyoxylase-like metal-dependent hydrolase (beta-lactamase superfamily II)
MHHHSGRDFFARSFGGILAGASILEEAFVRAGWARAQSPTATATLFNIEKVADGVFAALSKPQMLTNCNAAVFVGARDVLVVDAHSKPSAAAALIAQIRKEITEKPVRWLVNSHFHWDHTQGDAAYKVANAKVDIIASDTTKRLMQQLQRDRLKESLDGVPALIDAVRARLAKAASAPERYTAEEQLRQLAAYQAEMKSYPLELPTITFGKSYVVKDRAGDIHIEFHGRAHTAGDVQVFSPARKVVATGDTIIGYLPFLDDGYPRAWPRTIDSIGQLKFDHAIGGHGPVQHDRSRIGQLRNYIEDLTMRVEAGKKAGKTVADLQKELTVQSLRTLEDGGYGRWVVENFERFQTYVGPRTAIEDRILANIDAIYRNLDRV